MKNKFNIYFVYATLFVSGSIIFSLRIISSSFYNYSSSIPQNMEANDKIFFILILALIAKYWYIILILLLAHFLVLVILAYPNTKKFRVRILSWYLLLTIMFIIDNVIASLSESNSGNIMMVLMYSLLIIIPIMWLFQERFIYSKSTST